MLNDFTVEPLKRRLPSDVTFVYCSYRFTAYVLDIYCTLQYVFKYSCVLFMFVLLYYHAKKLRQYLSKTNGYVVLKRKCYPLFMRKTCGPVYVVTKIPVSVNLPT